MTAPQMYTKFFAQFEKPDFRQGGILEIENVQEAVNYGIKKDMGSFRTYEVTSVTMYGKSLISGAKNWSEKSYLSVDKIMTAADITALFEEKIKQRNASNGVGLDADGTPFNDETWAEIHARKEIYFRDLYKTKPADAAFIISSDGDGYIELKKDNRVYNRSGQQIWPKPSAPASRARPSGPRP